MRALALRDCNERPTEDQECSVVSDDETSEMLTSASPRATGTLFAETVLCAGSTMKKKVEEEGSVVSEDEETEMLTPRETSRPREISHPENIGTKTGSSHLRYVIAGSLLLVGAAVCLVSVMPGNTSSHHVPSGALGTETTGLFETAEYRSLMTSQVRSLMEGSGVEDGKVQKLVDNSLTSAQTYMANHASKSEINSLRSAHLGPDSWETLRALLMALSDKRVHEVGHAVLQEARANLLAGPAEIGKRVAERLQREHLLALAQELLPQKLRSTSMQRWAEAGADENDIWKMMLDPTGESLQRIRDNTTIESSALLGSSPVRSFRNLKEKTLNGPFTLNPAELTICISSVVFITAAETLLHIDIFSRKIKFPDWVHAMVGIPAVGGGIVSCGIAVSFWCDWFLGAIGINALEALSIEVGLSFKATGPSELNNGYNNYER